MVHLPVLLAAAAAAAGGGSSPSDTAPITCGPCAEWNQPRAPFRLHGDSYYVGVNGLSAVLIDTGRGLVLIDAGLPQSVPLIVANIEAVGRRVQDVKWILISHAHYDHVGGVAAIARMSGARVAATASAAAVLRAGMVGADDPQVGFGDAMRFPPVRKVQTMRDGATIRLGAVTLTMHHTPGHTAGGTSWTWRSCQQRDEKSGEKGGGAKEGQGSRCANMVYADSLNAVSAPGFRFSADAARLRAFRATIAKIRELPCDLLVGAHPSFSRLFEKHAAGALVDPAACRTYADEAAGRLESRLAEERAPDAAAPPR